MPRLLPRLVSVLEQTALTRPDAVKRERVGRKKRSLYRPVRPSPSFHPAGRTRSILLDENPITDKRVFARHKRLPPRVFLGPRPVEHDELDVPREMTAQEREWWSSPYLRMLATPVRQCMISKRYLPNDFLVRLAVLQLPATPQNARPVQVLVPDGLEHPKYKQRKARVAVYMSCWKDIVGTIKSPVSFSRNAGNVHVSKHLCLHISYLLRLRVFQEIEVLIDILKRNRSRVEFDAPTVIRRLTRCEFKTMRETGVAPFPDAVAVLVVPPVNRDAKTKLRPGPSQEPEVPSNESIPTRVYEKPLPPLSDLYQLSEGSDEDSLGTRFSAFSPGLSIPLYNGLAVFPSPSHRAALHKLLTGLVCVEQRFRTTQEGRRAKGDAKASHAFLVVSSAETVRRADTTALAIALWRLRMWEGNAFAGGAQDWEIGKGWRIG